MSRPKTGSIFKRGRIYHIAQTDSSRARHKESSGSRKREDADRLLKRRQGEIVTGKFIGLAPERITFAELSQEILDDYVANDLATLGSVQRRLKLHLVPALGMTRAAELSTSHLKRYIQTPQKQKAANASINRELAIVKRVFKLALREDPPKVARMPYIPVLRENNVRTGFLEHPQYLRLREALPKELRPLLVTAYHIASRMGELKSRKWSQVDLEAREIRLDPGSTKNRDGRTAPIYGEMIEWLKIEREIRDQNYPQCPWGLPSRRQADQKFPKAWNAAREAAGLPNLVPHDMRRSAAREMSRAGIPEKVIMAVCGWKTRSMFDRYNVVSRGDLDLFRARMKPTPWSGVLSQFCPNRPIRTRESKERKRLIC